MAHLLLQLLGRSKSTPVDRALGNTRLHLTRIGVVLTQPPNQKLFTQSSSSSRRILQPLFRCDTARPTQRAFGLALKGVVAEIKSIAHNIGGRGQPEISGLAVGVKGKAT